MFEMLTLVSSKLGDCNVKGYEELVPMMKKKFARVMFCARRELGVEFTRSQSTVSSGAPNPAGQGPATK
jgi:hypothetical protein